MITIAKHAIINDKQRFQQQWFRNITLGNQKFQIRPWSGNGKGHTRPAGPVPGERGAVHSCC